MADSDLEQGRVGEFAAAASCADDALASCSNVPSCVEFAPAASGSVRFPCGQEGVLALLPHRHPFVWVSRILECTPGESIVAELDVDPELPLFAGHFPNHPVFPGVLIMEALAQAASCCILSQRAPGTLGFFAGIDKAKFRAQVLPGDTIRLEAMITKKSSRMCVADVAAYKGDALCASATQKYVMA